MILWGKKVWRLNPVGYVLTHPTGGVTLVSRKALIHDVEEDEGVHRIRPVFDVER